MSETQKTAVIFGLANKRSIAWAIAQKLHEAGWRLAISYQNERMEQEAKDLITDLPGAEGFMCDVSSDDQIAKIFEEFKSRYEVLHGIVHSVAFAPAEELKGEFVNTTREGFRIAHDISVYSLIAVSRAAAPLMTTGGGIVTLAARGISGLGDMLKAHAERAPLKRNVDPGEVGGTAAFLLSDAGSGITGETIHVDCGYNIMGF